MRSIQEPKLDRQECLFYGELRFSNSANRGRDGGGGQRGVHAGDGGGEVADDARGGDAEGEDAGDEGDAEGARGPVEGDGGLAFRRITSCGGQRLRIFLPDAVPVSVAAANTRNKGDE